jgi:hypothetical protein
MSAQNNDCSFGISGHLSQLHTVAPPDKVAEQLAKLLEVLGENDPELIDALIKTPCTFGMLADLMIWNERVGDKPTRDRLGRAASLFWAAQTLVTTILRPSALDSKASYPEALSRALARGAEGLFEVGRSQFEHLAFLAKDIVDWFVSQGARSIALIESPLGNSLPVQLIADLATKAKIEVAIIVWNAPRNDRPSRGRTIDASATDCAEAARDHDFVLLIDEVFHGSRFIKLFEALSKKIDSKKFIPVAMMFEDSFRPSVAASRDRPRLARKLTKHHGDTSFPDPVREFPRLRLFRVDEGPFVRWQAPVIWGDSDMIPGKRKINLVFMIIDHCMDILEDLGQVKSEFRSYLELAWSYNAQGRKFEFSPDLLRNCFAKIVADLRPKSRSGKKLSRLNRL